MEVEGREKKTDKRESNGTRHRPNPQLSLQLSQANSSLFPWISLFNSSWFYLVRFLVLRTRRHNVLTFIFWFGAFSACYSSLWLRKVYTVGGFIPTHMPLKLHELPSIAQEIY
ncbi:hypothetical protein BDV37DRAFT_104909 [Aspergillus pseudonomiae]|uniref:Uncharacterized protein n=1 Tax=Aspergillus pseudonomiae TaxID=1506151 RepID=A0A5N7DGE2_9EURO|nr:uncharacterized protein BDV37DRAFT_104909 [Aspergillus pseudonomiae]KAE8404718.1 hypothetical protein BDV37DRAFT_104909 [Aspergillus pseudonomiae]